MYIIPDYATAVAACVVTMLCWGSWANTQKLASKSWAFPLFYWDYALGVVLLSLLFGLTLGSMGEAGRPFVTDLQQASTTAIGSAFLGGVVFNLANLLVVAAIDIAGMAVAFPVGIGIALVLGVVVNYVAEPLGNPVLLFSGVGLVTLAIVLDALAYRGLSAGKQQTPNKGIVLSIAGGILMGFFYRFVAASVSLDFASPEVGRMTPYAAVFVFSIGVLLSNFVWNSIFMFRPVSGQPVSYGDYWRNGSLRLHAVGLLGGAIWCIGMSLNILAGEQAGFAISYGLGQGATMVAAIWGVWIWKEFEHAPAGSKKLIGWMFASFVAGLVLIIMARV
ncbi:MAG: multidrug DMT transporter permease [Gemmatimonadota bacterium]|jgi:glucose uptake protein|nr:multidrug DMT transporter permease [Gemmatimonadota bacterium]